METVTKLTNDLVASYARVGGINHLDGKNLPSKTAITTITQNLLRLLFPGFFDEKLIHSSEIEQEITGVLGTVSASLEREIRKSLLYSPPPELPKKKKFSTGLKPAFRISRPARTNIWTDYLLAVFRARNGISSLPSSVN